MKANSDLTAPKLWIVFARCYRVMAQWAERSIVDLGICTSDFMVLEALLHKGPLTISEIQGKVLLASGSMTAAVDRVESLGLVVRTTTARDRRARVLELTPKGREMIEKAYAEHAEQLEAAMSVLDPEEKQELYETLKKLGHSVMDAAARPRLDGPQSN
jgi:MarR family 2-MHQ and catechol resistance regulon transcriptional repressor